MQAAWLGGLPLMRGMTIVAGLVELVFARFVKKLRFLFPPEITGMVVLMVAIGLIPLGVSKFLGIAYMGEPVNAAVVAVAAITLLVMVGLNVWGGNRVKLYSVLVGLVVGYILSFLAGLFSAEQFQELMLAPVLALPVLDNYWSFSFQWALVPVFAIVSITGALKSFGNLIMCEKVNDAEWREPDMSRISGGLLADAACVTASGLLGGVASDTSASNVALSSASGATSRYIGFMAGAIFILLGFFPKIAGLLSLMPMPVMGAILVYVTSFMIMSGIQIILGSGGDVRKTFVVGISMIFGLSLAMLPSLFASLPYWLHSLFDSPLTLSTVLAVALNQVFEARHKKEV
jgi:NCS2 family nucleobase:cation symporter-2